MSAKEALAGLYQVKAQIVIVTQQFNEAKAIMQEITNQSAYDRHNKLYQ